MDFRAAVVVHLCLLAARASCGVIRTTEDRDTEEALKDTAQLLRTDHVRPLLKSLNSTFGPFSNDSCRLLNGTELGEPEEERPLTGTHLSYFTCYTSELSKKDETSHIRPELEAIAQQLDSMAGLMPGSAPGNCRLPDPVGDRHLFHYAGCLLQRLDHRLSSPTF